MGNSLKEYRIVLSAELDKSLKATDKFTKDIKAGFIDLQKTVKKTSKSNVKTAQDASKETIALTKQEIKAKKNLSKLSLKQSKADGDEKKKITEQILDKELGLIKLQHRKEKALFKDRLSIVKGNSTKTLAVREKFAQKEIVLARKVATQKNKIEREQGKTSIKAARNKLQQNLEIAENATTALQGLLQGQFTPMAAMIGGPFGAAIGIGIDLLKDIGGAAIEAGEKFIDFNNTINNIASVVEIQSNIKLTTQEIDNLKVQILAIQTPIGVTSQDMASLSQTVASFEPPDKIIETTEAITDLFRIGKGKTGLENITAGVAKVADSLNITGREAADLTAVLSQEFKGKAIDPLGEALTELGTITSKANLAIKDGAKAGRESIEVFSQLVKSGTEVAESTTGTEEIFLALNDIMTNPELKKAMTKDLPEGMTLLDTGLQKGSVSATKFIDFMQRGGEATKQLATLLPSTAGESIQQLQVQFERTGKSINDFAVTQESVSNASKKLGLAFTNLKEQQMEKLEDRAESMTLTFGKHMAEGIESGRDAILGMADAMASADFSGFLRDIPLIGGFLEGIIDLFVDSAVEAEKAFQTFNLVSNVSDRFQDFTNKLLDLEGTDFLGKITDSMDMLKNTAPNAALEIERIQQSINLTEVEKVERIGNVLQQIADVKAFEVFEAMNDAISASEEATEDLLDDIEVGAGVQLRLGNLIADQRAEVDALNAAWVEADKASDQERATELAKELTKERAELTEWVTISGKIEAEALKQTQNRLQMSIKSGEVAKGNLTEQEALSQILASQAEQLEQQPEILDAIIEKSGQQIGLSLAEIDNLKIQNGLQVNMLDHLRNIALSAVETKEETAEIATETEKVVELTDEQLANQQAINAELDSELDALIRAGETEEERVAREKELLEIKKAELELSLASVENDEQRVKLAKAITSIDRQIAKLDKPDKKTEKKKDKKADKQEKKREKVADRGIKARESENDRINKAAEAREKAEKDQQKKIKEAADNLKKVSGEILTSASNSIQDIMRNQFQPSLTDLMNDIKESTNKAAEGIVTGGETDVTQTKGQATKDIEKIVEEQTKISSNITQNNAKLLPLLEKESRISTIDAIEKALERQSSKDTGGLSIKDFAGSLARDLQGLGDGVRRDFEFEFSNLRTAGSSRTRETVKVLESLKETLVKLGETFTQENIDTKKQLIESTDTLGVKFRGLETQKGDIGEGRRTTVSGIESGVTVALTSVELEKMAKSYQLILQTNNEIAQLQEEMLTSTPAQMSELLIDIGAKTEQVTANQEDLNKTWAKQKDIVDVSNSVIKTNVERITKLAQAAKDTAKGIEEFSNISKKVGDDKSFVETIATNTEAVKQFSDFIGGNFEKMNEKQFLFSKQKLENEIETNKAILQETEKALLERQKVLEAKRTREFELGDIGKLAITEKNLRNVGSELGNIKTTFEELEKVEPDLLSKESMKNAGQAFMKVGSIVSGTTDSILGFVDSIQNAQSGEEKIEAGADLAKTVGSVMMKSKVPQIALIGAFIVGAAMITKAILKIKEAVSGHEETDLDRAEKRVEKEDSLRNIQQARIGIMEKLVDLGQRNLDQAKEQLEAEIAINDTRIKGSAEYEKFTKMTAEQLASTIVAGEMDKQRFEDNISAGERALELDRDGRKEFLKNAGIKFDRTANTTKLINEFIADQNVALINTTTNIGLANDALDWQGRQRELNNQVIEEEIQHIQFLNTLYGENLANLEEISEVRKTALSEGIGIDLTGKSSDEIKAILAGIEDLSPPMQELATSWLSSVDSITAFKEQQEQLIENANSLLEKQLNLLDLNRDLQRIDDPTYYKDRIDLLQQQLELKESEKELLIEQGAPLGDLLDNEIERLGIELSIKQTIDEQTGALQGEDRVLTGLIRKHQQRLKAVRAGTGDKGDLPALRTQMVNRLKATGADDFEVQKFLDSLPQFVKGGIIPETGPIIAHEGELVIPKSFAEQISNLQSQPFTQNGGNSPLNLFNTPAAKITGEGIRNSVTNVINNIYVVQHNNNDFAHMEPEQALSAFNEDSIMKIVQSGVDQGKINTKR